MRLAGALTLSAGALLAASDLRRWWPDCPLGSFDTPACERAQDPALNLVPFGPIWHPQAGTAGLGGAAILLMGLAAGVLVLRLGQPWLRPCLLMFWPVPVSVVGLMVMLTGFLGHPAASAQLLAAPVAAWAFTGPTAAVGLAIYSGSLVRRGWPMLLALGLASPLLAMFSLPLHSEASLRGSTPWQWTPAALGLIVAGVVVLARRRALGAAVVPRHRPRHVAGPVRRARRAEDGGPDQTRPDPRFRIAPRPRRPGSWQLMTRRELTTSAPAPGITGKAGALMTRRFGTESAAPRVRRRRSRGTADLWHSGDSSGPERACLGWSTETGVTSAPVHAGTRHRSPDHRAPQRSVRLVTG